MRGFSIYQLKPAFVRALSPVADRLVALGIGPNPVTAAALLLSAATGGWFALRAGTGPVLWVLPAVCLVRMALNALDGEIARRTGSSSRGGAVFNELADVLADQALILPWVMVKHVAPAWVMLIALLTLLTEFAALLGIVSGAGRRNEGPFGKSDRAFALGLLSLVAAFGVPLRHAWPWIGDVFAALLALTIVRRVSGALAPPAAPAEEPTQEDNPSDAVPATPCREISGTFPGSDGADLYWRGWLRGGSPRRFLLLIHRGHEHSGRLKELAESLTPEDGAAFAFDFRGHGQSPGRRGHAPELMTHARDLECFVRFLEREHGLRRADTALVALSVGSVVAGAWLHALAPPLRAAVFAAPAFQVKLYVPFALPGLRLLLRMKKDATIHSYVKPHMLTHDGEQARLYAADPLITRDISVKVLVDLFDTSQRLVADAGALRMPALVLSAGNDWVVKNRPQRRFFERLGSTFKEWRTYPGFYHGIYFETDRARPIADTRGFLERAFAMPASAASAPARHGQATFEALSRPLPALHPRAWAFGAARAAMATVGRLSDGIALGHARGFDSGPMLDYVYENRALGKWGAGALLDRVYLDSPGWRAIRERRALLEKALETCAADRRAAQAPIRVVEVACGHGRYTLEALARAVGPTVEAELRDYDARNLEGAREHAARLGLANVTFRAADAFDPASYEPAQAPFTIAVVSGLLELFPDNAPVERCLQGLRRIVAPGGLLIFTNQPWHPQLEFIARVLTNREGQPWIMRCRSQREMDELAAAAGFRKVTGDATGAGICTVTIARREEA